MLKRMLTAGFFCLVVSSLPSSAFGQPGSCCQCIYFSNILCENNPASTSACSDFCSANNAGPGSVLPNAVCETNGLCRGNPAPAASPVALFVLGACLVMVGVGTLVRRRLRTART